MRRLNVERGLTFVLVTHDVDVGRKADRLVRMVDGEIVEQKQLLPPRRETFEAAHDGARAGVF
jgi:ABC-type methionine transport system ATPase subunit